MKAVAVIPARFAASRFPGKPLKLLRGKPIIQWVYERTLFAKGLDSVWVATDDSRIQACVESFGGKVIMTRPEHRSGTERLAEVAESVPAEIFINVQGDEPLIEASVIEETLRLVEQGSYDMSSAITPLVNTHELENRNVVKVVMDAKGRALYFTRFPIPYSRQTPPENSKDLVSFRHVGIYAYRAETLKRLSLLPPGALEIAESLEQLRALENGIEIGLAKVHSTSFGIDTPEDLERMEAILAAE